MISGTSARRAPCWLFCYWTEWVLLHFFLSDLGPILVYASSFAKCAKCAEYAKPIKAVNACVCSAFGNIFFIELDMSYLWRLGFWTNSRGGYEPRCRFYAEVKLKKKTIQVFKRKAECSVTSSRLVSYIAGNGKAFGHFGSLPFWILPFLLPYLGRSGQTRLHVFFWYCRWRFGRDAI